MPMMAFSERPRPRATPDRHRRGRVRHQVGAPTCPLCANRRGSGLHPGRSVLAAAAADVDVDAAGLAHQVLRHRAAEPVEPANLRRGADDDLGDVVLPGEAQDLVGHVLAGHGDRLAAEAFREALALGDAVALGVRQPLPARGFDVERGPGGMQPVGHPLGLADQRGRVRALADADDDALARGPRAPDGVQAHVREQLLVDPLGSTPERQLAQRRQVAGSEVVLKGALGRLRDINLALPQPLDQVVRRDVDDLDVVGSVEDAVRHRLAHPDPGDPGDDVVQALHVLDIERGVDVYPCAQDLLDVEVALGVARARRVGVRQFVHQHQLRPAGEDRVQVHLLQHDAAVVDRTAGDLLQPLQQLGGLDAPVGLDQAHDHVDALAPARLRRDQHLVGLADARRGAEEDLELAPRLALRLLQQLVGRRAPVGLAVGAGHGRARCRDLVRKVKALPRPARGSAPARRPWARRGCRTGGLRCALRSAPAPAPRGGRERRRPVRPGPRRRPG